MKIFLDTGNINEIREAAALGVLDGVTTNPTLIAKEGKPFKPTVLEICKIVGGPVSVEVVGTEAGAMCREGQDFASWNEHVVVKLPTTREGVQVPERTGNQDQHDAVLFAQPGAAGSQGGRGICESVCGPARRHQS